MIWEKSKIGANKLRMLLDRKTIYKHHLKGKPIISQQTTQEEIFTTLHSTNTKQVFTTQNKQMNLAGTVMNAFNPGIQKRGRDVRPKASIHKSSNPTRAT